MKILRSVIIVVSMTAIEIISDQNPKLVNPILIAAFSGWNDAGGAATWAVRHLTEKTEAKKFASLDAEPFYDFSSERPAVRLNNDSRYLVWPENNFHADESHSLIFVNGTEPQLKWKTFSKEIMELAQELNVSMVITLGSLLAEVPHSRPVLIHGVSEDDDINEKFNLQKSGYEGPTGIVGVLNQAASDIQIPNISLWATVPNYVAGAESPKAALALIERLKEIIPFSMQTTDLEIAAAAYERQINQIVEGDEETSSYVDALESSFDAGDYEQANPTDFVAEVEQFLREQE
ncbi:MAG: PAC2 family protein [Acidimicrobiales bacterium]|nr:PAC2 family protein [Acidimicrobiales bacterium]HJM28669.1 PAC2 family protein [Acidimicrobiales bacterium]